MTQTHQRRPDFRIYTAALDPDAADPTIVRMVGSSTETDVQKNRMALSAINDMCNPALKGMTIFLNHRYELPYDVYGILCEVPTAKRSDGFVDLHLAFKTDTANPAAAQTLSQIRNGHKHGSSIGCMVDKWSFAEESDNPFEDAVIIERVTPIEWSVVGIPANRRSWVQNAIGGLFTRSFTEGDYDTAYRLAPTMKSSFSYDYEKLILGLNNSTERTRFAEVAPRYHPDYQIMWEPPRKTFVLTCSTGVLSEGRQGVQDMLKTLEADERLNERFLQLAEEGDGDGKVAQQARSHKYGIGVKEGGSVTKPGKWSSVPDSEWGDPVNYRYPMPDKTRADNAASRWGDASNRSQYNSHEQSIIGGRIKRRQAELGGGDSKKEEKSMQKPAGSSPAPILQLAGDGLNEVGGEVNPVHGGSTGTPHVDNSDALPQAPAADDYNERDLGAEGVKKPSITPNDATSNPGIANNSGTSDARVNDEGGEMSAPPTDHDMLTRAVSEFLTSASKSNLSPDAGRLVRSMTNALTLATSGQLPADHEVHVHSMHDHANAILQGRGCSNYAMKHIAPDHEVHAQSIHNHAADMAGGRHCTPTNSDAPAQKSDGVQVPTAIQQAQETRSAVPMTALSVPSVSAEYEQIRAELAESRRQAELLTLQINQLNGRGMGRPTTTFTDRQFSIPTTHAVGIDTQEQTPADLRKLTTLQLRADGVKCRHWPDGLGRLQRPKLTPDQMSLMSFRDEEAYYTGRDVLVPILSDED